MGPNGDISSIEIRELTREDFPDIEKLINAAWPGEQLESVAYEQFTQEMDNPCPETRRVVATIDGRVVGTFGCNKGSIPSPQVLWVDWLVVSEPHRRMSIASLLYNYIERHGLELRKNYLCLDIGNVEIEKAAFAFHTRNGFRTVGHVPNYWGDGQHLNIMCKKIGG